MKQRFLILVAFLCALSVPMTASAFAVSGGKWDSPTMGTGASVTWSLMPTGASCALEYSGCTVTSLADFMPAGFLSALQSAFAAWSAVADITFVMVADDGAALNAPTTSGDIRLGGHVFDGASGVLAHGYYPYPTSAGGDIHFDIAENWNLGFAGSGFDLFQVMAHELGHAIGLEHSNVAGSLMNPYYTESFSGPQADDIAGAQYIYGAPKAQVPEPGMLALFGLALAGLVLSRRRAFR